LQINGIQCSCVSNAVEAISDHGGVTLVTENHYLDKPIAGYDDIAKQILSACLFGKWTTSWNWCCRTTGGGSTRRRPILRRAQGADWGFRA
jgi:hypothetical protein